MTLKNKRATRRSWKCRARIGTYYIIIVVCGPRSFVSFPDQISRTFKLGTSAIYRRAFMLLQPGCRVGLICIYIYIYYYYIYIQTRIRTADADNLLYFIFYRLQTSSVGSIYIYIFV
jgi:hypothetical protein